VSVLGKKCRALKKKLERIKALEEQAAAGKASRAVGCVMVFRVCHVVGVMDHWSTHVIRLIPFDDRPCDRRLTLP